MQPAGLARRYAAWSLDAVPLAAIAILACHAHLADARLQLDAELAVLADAVAQALASTAGAGLSFLSMLQALSGQPEIIAAATRLAAACVAAAWPLVLAFALAGLAWHAGFESSRWQATPGKRVLGLRVVGAQGDRIRWPRALLRQAAGGLSWLGLNLGHLWAALPPRHLAWHDVVARARVVQVEPCASRLPGWARAWLLLQLALACAVTAGGLETTNAALRAAFEGLA